MTKFRPSKEDVKRIRAFAVAEASRWAGYRRVIIRPGIRYNTEGLFSGQSVNLRLVTTDLDWDDTDLYDTGDWQIDFVRGFPLDANGTALLDFYVYGAGEYGELACNVQAEFDANGLLALHADIEKDHWRRDQLVD